MLEYIELSSIEKFDGNSQKVFCVILSFLWNLYTVIKQLINVGTALPISIFPSLK